MNKSIFSFNRKDGIGSSAEHFILYAEIMCFNSSTVAGMNSYNNDMPEHDGEH